MLLISFGLLHCIIWLLTKGVIYVVPKLFNCNCEPKFWIIYFIILVLTFVWSNTENI